MILPQVVIKTFCSQCCFTIRQSQKRDIIKIIKTFVIFISMPVNGHKLNAKYDASSCGSPNTVFSLQCISQTRAGVYEALCPQHMLVPDSNLEMIPKLDEAQICKGSQLQKIYGICPKVKQVIYSSSPIS